MKKVNGFTVFEEDDKCALDEYSAQLEKDINKKINDGKYDDTEIKQDILDIQQEQTQQNTKIETNSTEIATLKAENKRLKEENKDLKNVLPSGAENGENLTLEDSADMTFKKLQISGNTWQETRSGKNLWDNTNFVTNIPETSLQKNETGFVFSRNDTTGGRYAYRVIELKSGESITFSATNESPTGGLSSLFLYKDKVYGTALKNTTGRYVTYTATEDVTVVCCIIIDSGCTSVTRQNIQIEKNTVVTEYEQYGAMPSMEFLSQIRSCGDNINVFNKTAEDFKSGVTYGFAKKLILNLKPNTAYTCSTNDSSTLSSNTTNLLFGGANSVANGVNSANSKTVISDENGNIEIYLRENKIDEFYNNYHIKIEEGSVATPHSKFKEGNVNFTICNKNLIENLQNGYWDNVNKTLSNKDSLIFKSFKVFVKAGTYTLSCNTKINIVRAFAEYNNGEHVIFTGNTMNVDLYTITIEKDTTLYVSVRRNDNTSWLNTDLLQLEKEQTKTNYAEHKEQNYTFPLKQKLHKGDYLAEDGIHHKRREIVLDGVTDNLKILGIYKYENGLYYCTIALQKTAINSSRCYCSHFKYNGIKVEIGNCYITGGGGILVLVLEDQTITTVKQANNWLAEQKANGTPVTVNYLLAEEELEEYSEEQKVVHDEIMQAKTYKEKTHIFSNDEISLNFDVEWIKDTSIILNNLSKSIVGGN